MKYPKSTPFHCPRLPRSPHLLSQHLEVKRNMNEQISLLGAIDKTDLKHYLEKPRDDSEACVRDILANVLNPYCNVFVWTDDWDRSIENKHVEDCSDRNRVRMITLRNSQGFYGATILGANIEKSMLYHWLKRRGVEMAPHVALMQHLRYQEYPAHLGERLTIDYVLSGNKHFSKARRDRIVKSGRKLSDEIDDAVMKEVGASNFLLVPNADYKGKLLEAPGCRQISVASQGLNAYSNYTTLVFLAALNRSPDHMRMLNALGFDAEVMRQSTVYEHLHQCVMRTNLREPASSSKVQIIVPDRASADFLVGFLGKARVRHLGTASYEERQTYTKTERNRRSEFKRARHQHFGAARGTPGEEASPESGHFSYRDKRNCPRNKSSDKSRDTTDAKMYCMTLQEHVKAYKLEEFAQLFFDLNGLRRFLKTEAATVLETKTEGYLYQLTKFNPVSEGLRRQVNFMYSTALILDFDGGTLSPEAFIRIFWKDAVTNRRSFIICNSFSRSPANPNKFRVVLLFKSPATSIKMFQAVYDEIVRRLRSHGYPWREAKLDPACRSGIQPFFIPCINREHRNRRSLKRTG